MIKLWETLKKTAVLLLWVLLTGQAANGQISQVRIVNFTVKKQLPAAVDAWNSIPAALILVAQKTQGSRPQGLQLRLQIKQNGSLVCGNANGPGLPVDSFTTRTFSTQELTGLLTNCRSLKAGNYTLCAQFTNADRMTVSEEVCKEFVVEPEQQSDNYTAPTLISPENGKVFTQKQLEQPITFRWTPVVPKPKETVTYRLKVWQLMEGQSGTQAMRSNQPIATKEVSNANQAMVTNLITGPCRPPYLCDFVWQVQAVDREGKGIGGNGGMSEMWSFGLGISTTNSGPPNPIYTNTTGCPEIISPSNGGVYSTLQNLPIKVSLPKAYKGNATLYKISKDRDFLNTPASENWKVNRGIFLPNYEADSKALGFEPINLSLVNRNDMGELALDTKLSDGSYALVINNPGCFPVISSFAMSSAGCGTNKDLVTISCKGWINGVPTYTVSIVFSNIIPAAGGQQCITNMNVITSSTGTISGMSPVLPVIIPIGGNAPTVTFTYTPTNSSATTASFAYQGIWNDGNNNTSNFSNNNVPLPSCICDACKTRITLNAGQTTNTVTGNNWNITQSIVPTAPGLTIAAVKAEIISFQRYVGDECIDCNKNATQWGNFIGGSLGTINGAFANANNGVTGNTHHSLYWQVPTGFTGPLTAFNLNMSIPSLSNLTCCCDRIVTAIRYTYTFIDQKTKECIYCSIVLKYQQQKGNCPKVIEYNNDNPVKD